MAIVYGIAVGGAAAIGVALGWTEPYWVPEPILILTLYYLTGKRERIREKAIGTALGAIAAVPVAILAPPAWAISVLATAAFVLALWQHKRYWAYYGFYTFAIILVLSAPGQVGTEAAHRSSEILAGIGILVVALAILQALGTWLSKRYPQPELAENNENNESTESPEQSSRPPRPRHPDLPQQPGPKGRTATTRGPSSSDP